MASMPCSAPNARMTMAVAAAAAAPTVRQFQLEALNALSKNASTMIQCSYIRLDNLAQSNQIDMPYKGMWFPSQRSADGMILLLNKAFLKHLKANVKDFDKFT